MLKTHTDLEQSRKLSKILPKQSADMCWKKNFTTDTWYPDLCPFLFVRFTRPEYIDEVAVPCWSLTTLYALLPIDYSLRRTTDGQYYIENTSRGFYPETLSFKNPIDAYVHMILEYYSDNNIKRMNELYDLSDKITEQICVGFQTNVNHWYPMVM